MKIDYQTVLDFAEYLRANWDYHDETKKDGIIYIHNETGQKLNADAVFKYFVYSKKIIIDGCF